MHSSHMFLEAVVYTCGLYIMAVLWDRKANQSVLAIVFISIIGVVLFIHKM